MTALITDIVTHRGTFTYIEVPRRKQNDLPKHVKGQAWFHTSPPGQEQALTGYYVGQTPNDYAVEFLRVRGQDRWYILTGHKTTPVYFLTSSEERLDIDNKWNLGWWNINDPAHPEYIEQSGTATSGPVEEYLVGGLHHIATLKEKQPLNL